MYALVAACSSRTAGEECSYSPCCNPGDHICCEVIVLGSKCIVSLFQNAQNMHTIDRHSVSFLRDRLRIRLFESFVLRRWGGFLRRPSNIIRSVQYERFCGGVSTLR